MSKLYLSFIILVIAFSTCTGRNLRVLKSQEIANTTNNTTNNSSELIVNNETKKIISTAIDFMPYVGNAKCLSEAFLGIDLISGEKLSEIERFLSLVCGIPFGKFFKSGKNLKNGKKFLEAAKRAKKINNLKNYLSFGKASGRAFSKAYKAQNFVKTVSKVSKTVFRFIPSNSTRV